MTFKGSIRTCYIKKYATFNGRASRSEYWYSTLFLMIFLIVSMALFAHSLYVSGDLNSFNGDLENLPMLTSIVAGVSFTVLIAVLVPAVAVYIRRLHDRNISGWWYVALLSLSIVQIPLSFVLMDLEF